MASNTDTQLPGRVVRVSVDESGLKNFLARLRSFGEENAFAVRIAQSGPASSDTLVQMWREDIKGIAAGSSGEGVWPIEFGIAFYRTCDDPIPDSAFAGLSEDLREALAEAQGVTLLEER